MKNKVCLYKVLAVVATDDENDEMNNINYYFLGNEINGWKTKVASERGRPRQKANIITKQ